jgi:glutaredoxin
LDNPVVIYTKPLCRYCILAKELLNSKNIPYKEYNIEQSNYKLEMESKTNAKTVPQIFIDGKLIGGYDQLLQLYSSSSFFSKEEEPCILCSS